MCGLILALCGLFGFVVFVGWLLCVVCCCALLVLLIGGVFLLLVVPFSSSFSCFFFSFLFSHFCEESVLRRTLGAYVGTAIVYAN